MVAQGCTLAGFLGLVLFGSALTADEHDLANVDTALIFVVDTSSSIRGDERTFVRESHAHAMLSDDVLNAIRSGPNGRSGFAYIEFARVAKVRIYWTLVEDETSANQFARAITNLNRSISPSGTTNISAGLLAARQLVEDMPWQPERIVVDVVGDGIENDGHLLSSARELLLQAGAVINGVPLLLDPSEEGLDHYFATRVIAGPGAFSVPLYDIDELPSLLRQKIVMELF